jgi:putative membrane protein
MGATEVVHGVSGSTVAVILGIYPEFVQTISSIDREAVNLLRSGNFGLFWKKINGPFLVSIITGIVAGLFLLTSPVTYVLKNHFIIFSSFLFGIILISGLLILRKVKKWTVVAVFAFFAGVALNYSLALLTPLSTPDNNILGLGAGFLAGFAVTIPGLSSSFILLMIGKYHLIVTSFSEGNLVVVGLFLFGCLAGLWVAARFVHNLLARYYNTTVALLAGLTLGALNKLWPWRNVFEYTTSSRGEQIPAYDTSILPWHYMALTGKDPQVFLAILMTALGVFLVVLIEKIAAGLKTKI